MTYLVDVSVLLAWLWEDHDHNERVTRWQQKQRVAICPISELGFLRISTQPVFGASIAQARAMLDTWLKKFNPARVPCDLRALDGEIAPSGGKTTDFYLANLAKSHGMKFATLDEMVKHEAAFLIPF
jgi:predicted nucleic acid-binding protein